MAQARIPYRLVGLVWILLGSLALLISIGFIIAAALLSEFFVQQIPEVAALFAPSLRVMPSLQQTLGLLLGLFCIIIGLGLFGLQSWSRTVGVAFNITMGICVAIITIALFISLQQNSDSSIFSVLLLLIGGALAVFLVVVGYQLSTPGAMDSFFGFLPKAPPLPPVTCPTCNDAVLNISTGTCPVCDREVEADAVVRAKLVSVDTGQEYHVGNKKPTRIGRENLGIEIQLDDPTVSHDHAKIEYVDGHFIVHSTGTNGTYVNDMSRPVIDMEIKNGDVIAFAGSQFRFVTE